MRKLPLTAGQKLGAGLAFAAVTSVTALAIYKLAQAVSPRETSPDR